MFYSMPAISFYFELKFLAIWFGRLFAWNFVPDLMHLSVAFSLVLQTVFGHLRPKNKNCMQYNKWDELIITGII